MGVLDGILVVEAATLLAGPMAGGLLADFGARVIKVELPAGGDPLRDHPPFDEGVSLYSKVTNRNKESVALDLHTATGRADLRSLLEHADVFVTNFRPATLERWQLGYSSLEGINERLVMLQVSGYGNTGPYRDHPGFARIAESFVGLTYMTGYPDGPPTFAGYPVADGLSGVFGAYGVLLGLYERQQSGRGQLVDLPLYAPLLRMMEHLVIGYEELGVVPTRTGSLNPVVAPNSVFVTQDGQWIVLPVSTQTLFRRLAVALDHLEWLDDPRYATNQARVAHRVPLEHSVAQWTAARTYQAVAEHLTAHDIGWSRVNTIEDVCADPHIRARGDIVRVDDAELGRPLAMQGVVPQLSRTPGAVHRAGPRLGEHTASVLHELLGRPESRVCPSSASPERSREE